jgi:hypothetical protein
MSKRIARVVVVLSWFACSATARAQDEASSEQPRLGLRVFGGLGVGMRSLDWPGAGETLALRTGAFFALDVGASFWLVPSERFWIGPALVYQTSVGSTIEETHIAGSPDTLGVRVHRFEGMLVATFLLGSSGGFRIAPELGYGLRNLRPEVHHLLTPSYTLAGPLLRLGLRIPLGERLALRIAPELQWIVVGDALEEQGMKASGIGFGGELAFELALSRRLSIELVARYAHASLQGDAGESGVDGEQFVTGRLVWQP